MNSYYTLAMDQALAWIKANHEPTGILVSGSIIRGNPDASSDFDIYVIHDQAFRQRIQKRFNGVPCEIFINNAAQVLNYFKDEMRNNRPVTANMIATGRLVLGENDPHIMALVEDAKHYAYLANSLTDEQATFQKYAIATLFEDATDTIVSNPSTSLYILEKAIAQSIEFLFAARQQPLPRIKERLNTLASLEPAIGSLVKQYYQATDIMKKYELAKLIVLNVTENLGFFEWSTTPG